MSDNEIVKIVLPQDLPSRMVSLARVLARLPDGDYTIQMTKESKRIQAEIIQSVPVRHVQFDQDDEVK